jgi:hypothetical protein
MRKYKLAICEQQLMIIGKTQAAVARDCGLSRVIVNKFFTGKPIRAESALKIVTALRLHIEDVIVKRVPIPDMIDPPKKRRTVEA